MIAALFFFTLAAAVALAILHKRRNAPGAPDLPAKRENWLIGIGGDVLGKSYLVGGRTITIGRSPANLIQTTDPAASRIHCQIRPVQGGLQVVDMRSRNTTHVDGKMVTVAQIEPGAEIVIGRARFVYQLEAPAAADDALGAKRRDATTLSTGELEPIPAAPAAKEPAPAPQPRLLPVGRGLRLHPRR